PASFATSLRPTMPLLVRTGGMAHTTYVCSLSNDAFPAGQAPSRAAPPTPRRASAGPSSLRSGSSGGDPEVSSWWHRMDDPDHGHGAATGPASEPALGATLPEEAFSAPGLREHLARTAPAAHHAVPQPDDAPKLERASLAAAIQHLRERAGGGPPP